MARRKTLPESLRRACTCRAFVSPASRTVRRPGGPGDGSATRDPGGYLVQLRGRCDCSRRGRPEDHRADLDRAGLAAARQGSQISPATQPGTERSCRQAGHDRRCSLADGVQLLESNGSSDETGGETLAAPDPAHFETTSGPACPQGMAGGPAGKPLHPGQGQRHGAHSGGWGLHRLLEYDEDPRQLDGKMVVVWQENQPAIRWFSHCGRYALAASRKPGNQFPQQQLIDLEGCRAKGPTVRRLLWIDTAPLIQRWVGAGISPAQGFPQARQHEHLSVSNATGPPLSRDNRLDDRLGMLFLDKDG